VHQFFRTIRRSLGVPACPADQALPTQRRVYQNCLRFIQMFYAANLYLSVERLSKWSRWSEWTGDQVFAPVWPVAWMNVVDLPSAAISILLANLAAALLATALPGVRLFRVLAAITLLQAGALDGSFGKISHGDHMWLWTLIGLIFVPDRSPTGPPSDRLERQRTLEVVWAIQFILLMFYSMSGALKLLPVPFQAMAGQPTAFSSEALARHIADRLLQTGSSSLIGDFFIRHTWLGWPLFVGGLYLECFSLFVAFRPGAHRLWGLGLISLHIGIALTMNIWFTRNILLLALLFVNSPFAPAGIPLWTQVAQLPLIRLAIRVSGRSAAGQRRSTA